MSRPQVAEYARHGWYLIPIPFGQKGPTSKGWQTREFCVTDPDIAEYFDGNVGLAHAYSGTCAFDLDDLEGARDWWAARNIDIDDFLGAPDAVQISSGRENRAKLLYKLDKPLPSFNLGTFELRCASRTGMTVQDVLPPSIHPDTDQPYEWVLGVAASWDNLPELPPAIRAVWDSLITPDTKIVTVKAEPSKNLKAARKALFEHNPDLEYDNWVRIGMALHHESSGGTDGLDLWEEWSAKGTKFKGRSDLESHWRSFRLDVENPQTVGRLRIETAAAADDFEEITEKESKVIDRAAQVIYPRVVADISKEELRKIPRDKTGIAPAELPHVLMAASCFEVSNKQISHDTFKDALMIAPMGTDNEWRTFTDVDYTDLRLWLQTAQRFAPVNKDLIRDVVEKIGHENSMDSAQKWVSTLEWDGVPRIESFFPTYMGVEDNAYSRAVGLYMWTAMAGRVMKPGCQVDMVPILVGKQGIGKSQGVKALVPDEEFYVEIKLDDDDDAIARKMRGTLIGELAELRGLRTADLEKIKAFVTRIHEKWVPKYKEFATSYARRLVMIGTTNENDFLADDENRRWLPLMIVRVLVEQIKADRNQLWAEACERFIADGILWQDAERLAKLNQDDYKATDTWDGFVENWVASHPTGIFAMIELAGELGFVVRDFGRGHEVRLGKILRRLGYSKHNLRIDGKQGTRWKRDVDMPDIAC